MELMMANEKVLVVDDSPTQLQAIVNTLKDHGYSILTATDGEEALRLAVSERPDVIVLDVVLPNKNGFQICRQLKTSPHTKMLKVILLTSRNQESDRFWGMKQGADLYLTKPIEEEDLVARVQSVL